MRKSCIAALLLFVLLSCSKQTTFSQASDPPNSDISDTFLANVEAEATYRNAFYTQIRPRSSPVVEGLAVMNIMLNGKKAYTLTAEDVQELDRAGLLMPGDADALLPFMSVIRKR
jgi:hypothetical protein